MCRTLISIIIPCKNGSNYLAEALAAIKSQNMNIELIVVDDGSTDNTSEIAKSFGVKVIKHEESKGPVVAKNSALKVASGQYILFHDHDDVMNEHALQTMYNELEINSEISAIMCKVKDFISPDTVENNNSQIKSEPYYGLFTGAVLMRKSVFDTIGLFSEEVKAGEIIDWQTKMQQHSLQIKKLDIVSTYRRIHATNYGKTNKTIEFNDYAKLLRAKLGRK